MGGAGGQQEAPERPREVKRGSTSTKILEASCKVGKTCDLPLAVLYRISYFYDVFGTTILPFATLLARPRVIFDGGRNVFCCFSVAGQASQARPARPRELQNQ